MMTGMRKPLWLLALITCTAYSLFFAEHNSISNIQAQQINNQTVWHINYNGGTVSFRPEWNNSKTDWVISGFNGDVITIRSRWANQNNEWLYQHKDHTIHIKSVRRNKLSRWHIRSGLRRLLVTVNSTGTQWTVKGRNGNMTIQRRYNRLKTNWIVTDNMPDVPLECKMAALFPCILAGSGVISP